MKLPDFFAKILHPNATPAQQACDHYLSFLMRDGKHFCMSCKLVSDVALRDGEDA